MAGRFRLELRSAKGADVAGLGELMRAGGSPAYADTLASRIAAIQAEQGAVLLAVEWGPPSGVIALRWSWSLQDDVRTADVSFLLVDPAARRRGIGRLLIKAAAQTARQAGCGELRIAVAEEARDLRVFAPPPALWVKAPFSGGRSRGDRRRRPIGRRLAPSVWRRPPGLVVK